MVANREKFFNGSQPARADDELDDLLEGGGEVVAPGLDQEEVQTVDGATRGVVSVAPED